ncbi:MAG TPA: hypothetical protein VN829_04935, partial [Dongiaceae bacterium]|nr:hypothetical protein [Dongiaceae bacterium]
MLLGLAVGLGPQPASADPLPPDPLCDCLAYRWVGGSLNLKRGAVEDSYDVLTSGTSNRMALSLSFFYSSAAASEEAAAAVEIPEGLGWSHSYGSFLFFEDGV